MTSPIRMVSMVGAAAFVFSAAWYSASPSPKTERGKSAEPCVETSSDSARNVSAAFSAAVRAHRDDPEQEEMVYAEQRLRSAVRVAGESWKPRFRKDARRAAAALKGARAEAPDALRQVEKKAEAFRAEGTPAAARRLAEASDELTRRAGARAEARVIKLDALGLESEIRRAVDGEIGAMLREIEAHPERYVDPKIRKAARRCLHP